MIEPRLGLVLRNDRQNVDLIALDIVENANLPDTQPKLWLANASQPLDPASAALCRLVPEVALDSVPNLGANSSRPQSAVVVGGLRRNDDLESHSG